MTKGEQLAVVTGTTSGIGAALTEALLQAGWTVTGLARRPAPFEHPAYRHHQLDLGDLPALQVWAATHLAPALNDERLQRIGLVNNAALIGGFTRVEESDPEQFARVLAVNTTAPVFLMGRALRLVPNAIPLRIVNISSGAATQGIAGLGDYCASKAALRLAGMALAAELEAAEQPRDARLLSYEPGVVDTAMQTAAREADPDKYPSSQMFRDFHARGMLVAPPAVIGPVVEFLQSEPGEYFSEQRFVGGK